MPRVLVAVDPGNAGPTADFVSPVKRCTFTLESFKRVKLAEALRAQLIIVRNAIGSVACAWLVNACYSTGNVFSGKSSRNQSRRELIAANSVWAAVSFSTITLLAQIPLLLSLKFLDSPDRRPTFWFCLKKLVRNLAFYFVFTVAIMLGWSCFVGYVTTANSTLFKYKIDCYVNTLATHGFSTGLTLTTKKIYYRESIQGRDRFVLEQQSGPAPIRTQKLSFWRAYFKEFPKSAPAAVAGIFVHVLSQQRIMDRSNALITSFIIASFVFKFTIQEVIKHYIFKKRIRSIRVMCVAVALPTVLVDTQARIILLGTQSTNFLAFGTLGMAFLEICLRAGKAHFVYRKIRKRKAKRSERRSTALISSHPRIPSRIHSKSRRASSVEFNQWSNRVQAYHVAEIISDMYAEYIAIGCSASILVFFGDHPHYSLLRKLGMSENASERASQLQMLAFQVAVELIVDFLSIIFEKMAGVEFAMDKNVEAFLSVFLAAIAVLNINISIGVYLF